MNRRFAMAAHWICGTAPVSFTLGAIAALCLAFSVSFGSEPTGGSILAHDAITVKNGAYALLGEEN